MAASDGAGTVSIRVTACARAGMDPAMVHADTTSAAVTASNAARRLLGLRGFRSIDSAILQEVTPSGPEKQAMIPLIVLVLVTLSAKGAGKLGTPGVRDWEAAVRVGLAAMFFFTAAAHFNSMRPDMIAMVPPFMPNPEFMVTFTGICEILGAIGLLVPRTRA